MRDIILGSLLPNVALGYLQDDEVRTVMAVDLFAQGKSVILGVPGAFTPVCTKQHVPDFIANADKIIASGYRQLICIAPNDPFALDIWRRSLDPQSKIRFLSDGNLKFCEALGLSMVRPDLFLGHRSERYFLIVHDGVIKHVRVEPNILSYACTRPEDVLTAT